MFGINFNWVRNIFLEYLFWGQPSELGAKHLGANGIGSETSDIPSFFS